MPKGIYKRTEKHKNKIRDALMRNRNGQGNKGRKRPEWEKEKIRQGNLGKKRSQETRERIREAKLLKPTRYWLGKKISEETKEKIRKKRAHQDMSSHRGSNSHFWQGGKSFETYGMGWTAVLRNSIRQRDNYICQLCGIHQDEIVGMHKQLDIHHIDYNKHNLNPNNLVTLCRSCHVKTNFNRKDWTDYFNKENMKTIIYYTSNREDPMLEEKIRADLLKKSNGIPIISVSQKPIDLGKNICVGDVGHSYLNEWRQILIGAREAKTPYVIFAEADFLYPEEYFTFKPEGGNLYRYDNVWIVFKNRYHSYRRKKYSEGAQICKREYIIKMLEEHLEGQQEWFDGRIIIRDKKGRRRMNLRRMPFEYFSGKIACLSFKTGDGMRKMTGVLPGKENRVSELPYWGNVDELRKQYL